MNFVDLPKLGEPLEGGTFGGVITLGDWGTYLTSLLDDRPKGRVTWWQAMEWAAALEKAKGGRIVLPTRPVAAMLYAHLRTLCEQDWHWTSEEVERYGSGAWGQDFYDGDQSVDRRSYEGRARAVRLIPIGETR